MPAFDRTTEDLGNIVEFGHINLGVPDPALATLFYVAGLGFTRDPFMMPGPDVMWINVGQSQFHLPTRAANLQGGTIGLVVPDLDGLLRRCAEVASSFGGTRFAFRPVADAVELTCPWGNRFRAHAPDAGRFGPVNLGMPYVEFDVPATTSLAAIASFYRDIVEGLAGVATDDRGEHAWAAVGSNSRFIFRPADGSGPFDGYHVQVTFANFSVVHRRLLERGLVTEESNAHQYRFKDIVDPASGQVLLTVEHEVRSMRHPLYGRPLVNRNPDRNNRNYVPGEENWRWSIAVGAPR